LDLLDYAVDAPHSKVSDTIAEVFAVNDDSERLRLVVRVPPDINRKPRCQFDFEDIAQPVFMGWVVI
jgi:hypothetical protein